MKLITIRTAVAAILILMPKFSALAVNEEEVVLQAERELALAYQQSDADGIRRGVMEDYTLTNSRGQITTRCQRHRRSEASRPEI
jgi:hypothetical protein